MKGEAWDPQSVWLIAYGLSLGMKPRVGSRRGPFVAIDRLSDFNGEVVSPLFHDPGGTGSKTPVPQCGAVSQFSQAFRVSFGQGQKEIYLMPQGPIMVFLIEYLSIRANNPLILDGLRH